MGQSIINGPSKFFKCCLLQILLGPLLNTLPFIYLIAFLLILVTFEESIKNEKFKKQNFSGT